MEEIWKAVPNFEGYYEVSNLGRIRNAKSGKLKEQSTTMYGYKDVTLFKHQEKKHFVVHRLVALAFLGEVKGKDQINHIDHNKQNNVVTNLEWVTALENTEHEIRSGRNKTRNAQLRSNERYRTDKVQLTILLSEETNKKLEEIALRTGKSRTRIIRDALDSYLEERYICNSPCSKAKTDFCHFECPLRIKEGEDG